MVGIIPISSVCDSECIHQEMNKPGVFVQGRHLPRTDTLILALAIIVLKTRSRRTRTDRYC